MIISHGITEKGNYEKYIRTVSNDRKLSISERGMLFTLLSIPEGFSFNANVISESVKETPMTIKKRLQNWKIKATCTGRYTHGRKQDTGGKILSLS